jgi:hypothetical protein
MEIYDRQQGRADTKKPTGSGHITVTATGIYVNCDANHTMKLSRKKKVLYGKKYKSLMVGVTDRTNPKVVGWTPTITGNSASVGSSKLVQAKFTRGKYTITGAETKDNITWFRLTKKK